MLPHSDVIIVPKIEQSLSTFHSLANNMILVCSYAWPAQSGP